ncbi:MAG: ankyrin repeat domain-containing protein [Pseudomonadota bacterium]
MEKNTSSKKPDLSIKILPADSNDPQTKNITKYNYTPENFPRLPAPLRGVLYDKDESERYNDEVDKRQNRFREWKKGRVVTKKEMLEMDDGTKEFFADVLDLERTITRYSRLPIVLAARQGDFEKVKDILTKTAQIPTPNTHIIIGKHYALEAAVQENNWDVANLLLLEGASVEFSSDEKHSTLLMQAIEREDSEALAFLISHKANPNCVNPDNKTALQLVAEKNNPQLFCQLVSLVLNEQIKKAEEFTNQTDKKEEFTEEAVKKENWANREDWKILQNEFSNPKLGEANLLAVTEILPQGDLLDSIRQTLADLRAKTGSSVTSAHAVIVSNISKDTKLTLP